jgi:hypothetical protein
MPLCFASIQLNFELPIPYFQRRIRSVNANVCQIRGIGAVSLLHSLVAQHQQIVKSQTNGTALSLFTLGPKLVGGAPPPNTPGSLHSHFLHPSAQTTVAAKCRTFIHAFLQKSYERSTSQSFLSKQVKSNWDHCSLGARRPPTPRNHYFFGHT